MYSSVFDFFRQLDELLFRFVPMRHLFYIYFILYFTTVFTVRNLFE